VAGQWRRNRVTAGQKDLLAALQSWLRGAGSLADVLGRLPGALAPRSVAPRAPQALPGEHS
jgi:hypothetical protein